MWEASTAIDVPQRLDEGARYMNEPTALTSLHRSVKLALDSGEAATIADAEALFRGYRLQLVIGNAAATSPSLQSAAITAVNAASRCFLGGVQVAGSVDFPLFTPLPGCSTMREAILALGGDICSRLEAGAPLVVIGADATLGTISEAFGVSEFPFAVRATFEGWVGACVPLDDGEALPETQEFPLAGVLAGALSVSEAFQHVRGDTTKAGQRELGMSLWKPETCDGWRSRESFGPSNYFVPSRMWLVGLGHLGQAYLWSLGQVPFPIPSEVSLVLQDFDVLGVENVSTSPLTFRDQLGMLKTRAMARWCEEMGFKTIVCERKFADNFRVAEDEPDILLCGVDNPQTRALVERPGFRMIVEAGLGSGEEYRRFQVHTFPGPQRAGERWPAAPVAQSQARARLDLPGYRALAKAGIDECGLIELAGRSVGASFVGLSVAPMVIAELIRAISGGVRVGKLDGDLGSLDHRTAIGWPAVTGDWNPGSQQVRA